MRRVLATIVLAILASALPCEAPATSAHFRRLESGPLPEVRQPSVKEVTLPNGIRCYLLSDHTLPIVKVGAVVRAGSTYDPPRKVGLAALSASLMRIGGAGGRSPEEFDAALDNIGAQLASSAGREMSNATLDVLSVDLREGLSLMFDMLFSPRFDKRRLKTARRNMEEAILREDDDPGDLASYRLRQLVYGKASPWARRPSKRSIRRIGVDDIREFHDNYFKAGNIILTAAGDFSYDEILKLLKEFAAAAPTGEVDFAEVPPVKLEFDGSREDIVRPTSQAFIRMGHLSIKRHNPDKFALFLVDSILGASGFKSRLMEDIRVRRGMAYSVYSGVIPSTDYGLFVVGLDTKAGQADEAMGLVRDHMKRLVGGDITVGEMKFAKKSIISRLVFLFDQPFKVVNHMARFYFYGYPKDYWRIYRDRIVGAKLGDLKRVAKEYLHPDGLDTVVVGPRAGRAKKGKAK